MSHKDRTGKNLLSGFYDPLVSGSLDVQKLNLKLGGRTFRRKLHLLSGRMLEGKLKHEQQIPLLSFYNMIGSCAPLLLQKKLKKCDSNIPDLCFKTGQYKGTFFHCVWECTKISYFIYTNNFCDHQL